MPENKVFNKILRMTTEKVLSALSNVQEPDLGKDIVTLGMVKDIEIEGNYVAFTVVLTPNPRIIDDRPPPPKKDRGRVEGVLDVSIHASGDRMRGEFVLSEEQLGGDGVEGDITEFIGVRANAR